ncbi:hypothetical protein HN51_012580 [Arachis hypogaea]
MHEYNLTLHSLYSAVSVGSETETIINVLTKLSKTKLPKEMIKFIHDHTRMLKKNSYFVESPFSEACRNVLKTFLKDKTISRARIVSEGTNGDGFTISKTVGEIEGTHDELFDEAEVAAVAEDKEAHLFEIDPSQVNPDIDMELKPQGKPPPYQEKSLSKMFGNGRARSGIIVLPRGTGKSLVGVSAACRMKQSCLCLATNGVSVDQWPF